MISDDAQSNSIDSINTLETQEVKLQFHWYLFSFFLIFLGSLLIPGLLFMLYVLLFFVPYFLENPNFFNLFMEINSLLVLITMPLVMIGCYLLHLIFVGIITRWGWGITEKKCPTTNGIIQRNIRSVILNYYHVRSFMIKYPKNAFVKGPFPWLANWLFNFVKSAKIGKGSTVEEENSADKFIDIGKNCYVGVNSAVCSHTVEGIHGRIPYFEIKLGDNVTCAAFNIIGPGCQVQDNSYLLPLGSLGKHQNTKGNNYYFGLPARKIFTKKIMDYLQISKEDLEKDEQLRIKLNQMKSNDQIKS
jgi:acetyltransferase-like isoleucine patch superfamily enzyme